MTEDDAAMVTRSRINLVRSWLVVDRHDRLVYLTGTRYVGPYWACALVLAFLAAMAYPVGHRRPTASDTRVMGLLDRVHTGKGLLGITLLVPPARLRDRSGASPQLRPFYRGLAGLLALGALIATVCPLMHRVHIRAHSQAGLLRVRDLCPLRTRAFELPLPTSAHLALRPRWPRTEREMPPSDSGEPIRWALELVPPTALPPMDIHTEPTGNATARPPHRARHLAERLADMTGWALDETDVAGPSGSA